MSALRLEDVAAIDMHTHAERSVVSHDSLRILRENAIRLLGLRDG